jgi:lysophospholipase L1-like esterase
MGWPGFTADTEVKRQQVNRWIRTSGAFDRVIDFDAALRDAQDPTRLAPEYDSGDHLHPNDAGHEKMGDTAYRAGRSVRPPRRRHVSAPAQRAERRRTSKHQRHKLR